MKVFVNGNQEIDPKLVRYIIREYEKEKFQKIKQDATNAEFSERKKDVQKTEGNMDKVSS